MTSSSENPALPVVVSSAPTKKRCSEHALVLQALGIPHQVVRGDSGFHLVVPGQHAAAAVEELGRYRTENVDWPPRYPPPPRLSSGTAGAIVYGLVLLALYPAGQRGAFGLNWWEVGKTRADLVLEGEVWRVFTALTLHGDLSHLVGNIAFGAAFAVLASHTLGSGLTWLCTVLAGALGNFVNAAVQAPSHSSIGASTAVFGALGLLAAYEWVRRHTLRYPPMRRFAPLGGGAVLLGFLGTSGERTDVPAHLFGLAAGLLLGWIVGKTSLPDELSDGAQTACGVLAVLTVAAAWAIGLSVA